MADNTQSFVDGLANAPAPELTLTPQLDDQASATTALAQPAPDSERTSSTKNPKPRSTTACSPTRRGNRSRRSRGKST